MLEIILFILLNLSQNNDLCSLGNNVDWDTYALQGDMSNYIVYRSPELDFDYYLDDNVLFVYSGGSDVLGTDGHSHGQCAIKVNYD